MSDNPEEGSISWQRVNVKIAVIGLGKLGAPWAAVLAAKGHDVIGVDTNAAFVSAINQGKAPVSETGLGDLISRNRNRLKATESLHTAVMNSDVTFIVVATPSREDGAFSLQQVEPIVEAIGAVLSQKSAYHLVVMTSTIMPGDTDSRIRPALEKASGRRCGVDFGLCYNPEFIALGTVIRDMLKPDFILIGESDSRAGDQLAEIQRSVCENNPTIVRMNFVNAEITKLTVNAYVTTKISFGNTIARVCEQIPGADAAVVTRAIGMDTRIGPKYLSGAVSFGGPCFPRDNVAFAAMASKAGTRAPLAEATHQFNLDQVTWLKDLACSYLPPGGRVGVLGLTYKPNTDVCTASAGLLLAQKLCEAGVPVTVYDPAGMTAASRDLGDTVHYADSPADCACESDVLVITTAWDVFALLTPPMLKVAVTPTIIDCWRLLDAKQFANTARIVTVGMGPAIQNDETSLTLSTHPRALHGQKNKHTRPAVAAEVRLSA